MGEWWQLADIPQKWLSDSVTQWLSLFPPPYWGCFLLTDCKYINYILYIYYYIYNISTIKRVEHTGGNKLSHWVTESLSHFLMLMDILLNHLTGRTLGQKTIFRGAQLIVSLFSILRVRIINAVSNWKLLKIGPYHPLKFGGSRKKPYLCTVVRRKAALGIVQVNLTLRSFALSLHRHSEIRRQSDEWQKTEWVTIKN